VKPGTLLRLAVAGTRTDTIRVVLTALSAALASIALLAAATVASITGTRGEGGYALHYPSPLLREPGLRPGVIAALLLLALPVLALAGQCIRLGAPARDRRLAAIRLAGATPGQAVLVASAETAVASLLGAVLGLGGYLVLRAALHDPKPSSGVTWSGDGPPPPPVDDLPLPTDVRPGTLMIVVILLAIPLLAGGLGALLLRRVIVTPLGVVRRTRDRAPRAWTGGILVLGIGLFAVTTTTQLGERVNRDVFITLMGTGVALTMIGVVLGTGWISYSTGRLLLRFGRGPAVLLAARRLLADPWNGSRTFAALLAGVIAGAIALGYRKIMETEFAAQDRFNALLNEADGKVGAPEDPSFYLNAVDLVMVTVALAMTVAAAGVLIALVESVVARRRTQSALVAAGVPQGTLSAAVLWHTMTPLVPAVLVSLGAGLSITRLLTSEIRQGGSYENCTGTPEQCASGSAEFVQKVVQPEVVLAVPVPYEGLALLGAGALLAMLVVVGIGVLVQQRSTNLEELRVG
jgi:hypothetical protein